MWEERFELIRRTLAQFDLRTAPVELLAPLPISELSKGFLSTVGLPVMRAPPALAFNQLERLPNPQEVFPRRFNFDESWRHARMLHFEWDGGIYIDVSDGSIWYLAPPTGAIFMNSSVELLGYFLAESNSGDWGLPDVTRRGAQLQALQRRLHEADPDAFDVPRAEYWPIAFEEAGY